MADARGKKNGAVGMPRAALALTRVRQVDRLAVRQGNREQASAGEETNRAAVGREERRVRAGGAGHRDRLELIDRAEEQAVAAWSARNIDDARAVRRKRGDRLGGQARRGRLFNRERNRRACEPRSAVTRRGKPDGGDGGDGDRGDRYRRGQRKPRP